MQQVTASSILAQNSLTNGLHTILILVLKCIYNNYTFALQVFFLYTLLRFSCYCLNKTTIILCPSRSPPLQQTKVDMAWVWGCMSLNHRGERPLGRCSGEQDFTMEIIWSLSGMRLNERVGFTNEVVLLQKRHVALLAWNGWYWCLPISFFLSGLSR